MNKLAASFVLFLLLAVSQVSSAQEMSLQVSFESGFTVSTRTSIPFTESALVFNFGVDPGGVMTSNFIIAGGENLKKLPSNELKKIDAHKFKKEVVGGSGGEYDIYWDTSEPDKDKRKIKLIKISDTSVVVDSGDTWADVKSEFPAVKKNENPIAL